MPRVQVITCRDNQVLMVRHRVNGKEHWCLPGGSLQEGETLEAGALRELAEECQVNGKIIRKISDLTYAPDDRTITFLVDIGDQEPLLGHDPDVEKGKQVLIGVKWLALQEIPERDRVYLWAAGLLGTGEFLNEVLAWGDEISYPKLK